jgi:hypothetical protein
MKNSLLILCGLCFLFIGCTEDHQRKVIRSDNAPAAIGPYSQAIHVDDDLYLAGQIVLLIRRQVRWL